MTDPAYERSRRRESARRRASTRVQRQRAGLGGIVLALVLVVVVAGGGSSRGGKPRVQVATRVAKAIPAVESGLLPWHLPTPISREVVLAGHGSRLVLLGGLNGSTSASGVYSLDTADGALRPIGTLRVGVHDAAGSIVGGRDVIFGGGTPATTASVEAFPATRLGSLPSPRSDSGALSVGNTTYIVGGYTGHAPDSAVLSTSDGVTYRSVASLAVPVRYPAVVSTGGKLYVFGGQVISGPRAGLPTGDVQMVDPASHSSRVIGQMPAPLQASAAFELDGQVYLAGGDTTIPQPGVRGVGTSQAAVRFGSGGSPALFTTSTIWAFDPAKSRFLVAGRLQVPVSHAGVAVSNAHAWLVGGESGGTPVAAVQMVAPNRSFGAAGAPGAGSPYFGGKFLIADRGNNRLLLLDTSNQIVWRFPSASTGPDPFGFFFPDDAFFIRHGTAIISNQEQNETVQEIAYPSGKIIWSYGHPHHAGAAPGYLHEPDDAYLLRTGQITVADADNCRVLVIDPNHTVAHKIGTGACTHHPPTSRGTPNGDTPLADGNLLISETIGSWIDEVTPGGHTIWTLKLPISYPSDPQQLGADRYLVADYATPGQIDEFDRAGKILYRYDPTSGPGMLDHPSLVELLPSGVFMVNDDYRHRVAAIDPTTQALVWQYGVTDQAGTAMGRLNTPDGFDLLMPDGSTPTHRVTG
jgi:hypothetical protein